MMKISKASAGILVITLKDAHIVFRGVKPIAYFTEEHYADRFIKSFGKLFDALPKTEGVEDWSGKELAEYFDKENIK